eukprot:3222468-Pyramimonas_sp.AAC.1
MHNAAGSNSAVEIPQRAAGTNEGRLILVRCARMHSILAWFGGRSRACETTPGDRAAWIFD